MKRFTTNTLNGVIFSMLTLSAGITVAAAPVHLAAPAASAVPGQKTLQSSKRTLLETRQQKIEHEAMEVVMETKRALMALQKKDSKKALALLQDTSGKLDILLAKYSELELIPASVEADVYDFDTDSEESGIKRVKMGVKEAGNLLNAHQVQDARRILDELVSEMRITTTSIPLGTFPTATKEAAKLIDQGKNEAAADALYEVLSMLVKTTEIVPLPILRAEILLNHASELEQKKDLNKEANRDEILRLADAAKEKLKLAELLGYGKKENYKSLYLSIDQIREVIFSKKSTAVWDQINKSLSSIKEKLLPQDKK